MGELEKAIAELIRALSMYAKKGIETLQTIFPTVCKQLLVHGVVSTGFGLILSTIFFLISSFLLCFIIQKIVYYGVCDSSVLWCLFFIPAIVCFIASITCIISGIYTLIEIKYAPAVYLLNEFKSIIKGDD